MIKQKVQNNIKSIFTLGGILFIKEKDKIVSKYTETNLLDSVVYFDTCYFTKIYDGYAEFYDLKMNFLKRYENNEIEKYSSKFTFIDKDKLIWDYHNSDSGKNTLKYIEGVVEKVISDPFFGNIINSNFRLNFPDGIFLNPNKFTFSDILGQKSYWEYKCEEGFQASNLWIVGDENLIFCESKSDNFAGMIVKIHLTTGQIIWKSEIANTNLHYNEDQGILISFWASEVNGKNYQIIDIDKQTIDFGETETSYKLENVNTNPGTQYLHKRKLYFADQIMSISGEAPRPVKFGCFDIDTKKIDFLQEIPEARGTAISQIIYNENKLYIRTWCNRLFIYE